MIYPNPASESISWDRPIDELRIFDALGKLVLQRSRMRSTASLSVIDLDPGLYTVVITAEEDNFSQKLILR